jgi:hypothetical protein
MIMNTGRDVLPILLVITGCLKRRSAKKIKR